MEISYPLPNTNKNIERKIGNALWARWPLKTPVIKPGDYIPKIVDAATRHLRQDGDLVIISESVVAIAQNRAFRIIDIKPGFWANFLSDKVSKVPHGIGLGMPETMQLAINECGLPRILLAAVMGGLGKIFGLKGIFYHLAPQASLIDGPCPYKLPPYNQYATLGPKNPQKFCEELSKKIGVNFAIVDANDLGTKCLGAYPEKFKKLAEELTRDNPMGQGREQTPIIIARKIS